MINEAIANQSSNFQLKNEHVELIGSPRSERASMSLRDLESLRTSRPAVPASKHGLETICGVSCETGAQ